MVSQPAIIDKFYLRLMLTIVLCLSIMHQTVHSPLFKQVQKLLRPWRVNINLKLLQKAVAFLFITITLTKKITTQPFKESCITAKQTQIFCSINAHYHNGRAEQKIKTVISFVRVILFAAIVKQLNIIHVDFQPYAVYYAIDIINNTSNASSFTPKEIFIGV